MENEMLYEWSNGSGSGEVQQDGDNAMLVLHEASELAMVLLTKDQARALAAALIKWAGPEENPVPQTIEGEVVG